MKDTTILFADVFTNICTLLVVNCNDFTYVESAKIEGLSDVPT